MVVGDQCGGKLHRNTARNTAQHTETQHTTQHSTQKHSTAHTVHLHGCVRFSVPSTCLPNSVVVQTMQLADTISESQTKVSTKYKSIMTHWSINSQQDTGRKLSNYKFSSLCFPVWFLSCFPCPMLHSNLNTCKVTIHKCMWIFLVSYNELGN